MFNFGQIDTSGRFIEFRMIRHTYLGDDTASAELVNEHACRTPCMNITNVGFSSA